jgi:hypothetical protein
MKKRPWLIRYLYLKEEKTSKNQFLCGTFNVAFTGSEAGGAS